ncbi:hypothetical protein SAMN05660745_02454 [Corynebacterium glucuronolyticum]|nr:hypothetical protein CGLUCO_00565 [Corynebacterium glucuronolyticum DSM 44120]SMB81596.1 hypothetical protein SAMN05660745_02454 [Corynebacterium glucuronolyticum]
MHSGRAGRVFYRNEVAVATDYQATNECKGSPDEAPTSLGSIPRFLAGHAEIHDGSGGHFSGSLCIRDRS